MLQAVRVRQQTKRATCSNLQRQAALPASRVHRGAVRQALLAPWKHSVLVVPASWVRACTAALQRFTCLPVRDPCAPPCGQG